MRRHTLLATAGTSLCLLLSARAWEESQPYRIVLEVPDDGLRPGAVVSVPLDFGAFMRGLGSTSNFNQYSLRVKPLDGPQTGQELPHRLDHAVSRTDGSVDTNGRLVFCVPPGGAERFAAYFGPDGPAPGEATAPPLIGDGDQLRLAGTDRTSLAAPGLYPCVIDYDGDGRRDLVGSDRYGTGARVVWFRNIGTNRDPAFSEHEIYPIQTTDGQDISNPNHGWLLTVALCDWDADGTRDLLVGGWCRYLSFYRNSGTDTQPRFAAKKVIFDAKTFPGLDYGRNPDTPYQGVFIEPVDWNGDGQIDLLCGTYCRGHIYLLPNTGRDADGLPVLGPPEPLKVAGKEIDFLLHSKPSAVDRDGDGDVDLMSGQYHVKGKTVGCYYFENTGSRDNPELAEAVQLKDANGDIIRPAYHMVTTMTDWDLDGRTDVLVSSYASTLLYLEEGAAPDPKLTLTSIPCVGYEPCRVLGCFAYPVVVDWDADGVPDIVTGDGEGTVQLFRGTGNLQFAAPILIESQGKSIDETGCPDGGETQRGYVKVAVADWNWDGFRDLIMWTENGERGWQRGWKEDSWCLKFFPGTDDPMDFGAPSEIQAAGEHIRAGYRCKPDVADLDGDGLLDLVVACGHGNRRDTGTVVFFENIGTKQAWRLAAGTPLMLVDGSEMRGPVRTAVRLVDWDADGDLDLLTGNHSPRGIRYWENQGTRSKPVFAKAQTLKLVNDLINSHHELGVDAADLDGDGTLDLVVGRGDTGTLHFFRGAFLETQPIARIAEAASTSGKVLTGPQLRAVGATDGEAETRAIPTEAATDGDHSLLLLSMNGTHADSRGRKPVRDEPRRFTEGRFGQGLHLSGKERLAYETAGSFDPTGGVIQCWVKPDWDGGDGRNHYLFSAEDQFPNSVFWLLVGTRGELVLQTCAGRLGKDPTMRLTTPALNWKNGQWHVVRCEWNKRTAKLFVDGLLAAVTQEPVTPTSVGKHVFVGNLFNGGWCLDGVLDDFQILRLRAQQ